MKLYAVLVFASLWLIHIRLSNAINAPGYPPMNFRPPGGPQAPYRRAHQPHHHAHPKPHGQFKKKWYPPLSAQNPGMNHRPRRPINAPAYPPIGNPNYMRQRLGHGAGAGGPIGPVAPPPPSQAQSPSQLSINSPKTQVSKWNYPTRALKAQPSAPSVQSKPFQSSPKIQSEVEYHVGTNQIPNAQPVMIKQLDDEKGPIHTIPAPNLSLADKPKQVHIHQPHKVGGQHHLLQPHFDSYESTTLKVLKPHSAPMHQYQVTEAPSDVDGEKLLLQDAEIPPLKPDHRTPSDDAFGLLPVQDSFSYSVLHQPQLQQHILQQQQSNAYQTMLVQPQFFQPEPTFLESQGHKLLTPPEMHTFNYVEPKHDSHATKVSAEYVLEAQDGGDPQPQGRDDPLAFYSSPVDGYDAGRRLNAGDQAVGQSKQQEMMIYVPDESEQFDPAEDLEQYEAKTDAAGQEKSKAKRFGFGSRLRPKSA